MLQQMGQYLPKPKYEVAGAQENKKKNRHPDTLPGTSTSHKHFAWCAGFFSVYRIMPNVVMQCH